MQHSVRKAARGIDPWLTLAVLALLCIGVIMVYSASVASSYVNDGSPYYVIQREIVWVVIAFAAFLITMQIDYLNWQRIALPFFGASLARGAEMVLARLRHLDRAQRDHAAGGDYLHVGLADLEGRPGG